MKNSFLRNIGKENNLFVDFISRWRIVAIIPGSATVFGDMASSSAVVTNDRISNVGFVGTLPRFMSGSSTVRAPGAEFAFSKRSVQHG